MYGCNSYIHNIVRTLLRTLRYVGTGLGFVVLFLLVGLCLLNTQWAQDRICQKTTDMLSWELNTHVTVGKVRMDVRRLCLSLHDVEVEDQQDRPMFRLERLSVRVSLIPLFRQKEVRITHVRVSGLRAQLFTPPVEEKPNFQFVIDSLANKHPHERQRRSVTVDVDDIRAERINVEWNGRHLSLGKVYYNKSLHDAMRAGLSGLSFSWEGHNKRGPMDCVAYLDRLELKENGDSYLVTIDNLRYTTDNHQPRRNVINPRKGFFDTGHLDVTANIGLRILHVAKDTLSLFVTNIQADDEMTGFHVHDMHFALEANRKKIAVSDMSLFQGDTQIRVPQADILLSDKAQELPLRYEASDISARVLLKDLSRPFTPVLRNFVLPIELTTGMEGEGDMMRFREVHVWTADRQFDIRATGGIENLRDKELRLVHFDIGDMNTTGKKAMQFIGQLAIKKFMMKQLSNLGRITYGGRMDIRRKQEHFQGHLSTAAGPLDLDFTVDGRAKYVTGRILTDSVMLGKVIDMPAIGRTSCTADFRFDISKERTARMRRRVGGKLPMGEVRAHVTLASFKKIKVHNLLAKLQSNGALAQGKIEVIGRRTDLLCSFSFTNTDSIHKMKVKPGIRFHKMSKEQKQAKAEKAQ